MGRVQTLIKKIGGNIGYRTANTGSATIVAGTKTIVVTHGLGYASTAGHYADSWKWRRQKVQLTLMARSITSTQFTILTAAAPWIYGGELDGALRWGLMEKIMDNENLIYWKRSSRRC